jgi:hypothetical protein
VESLPSKCLEVDATRRATIETVLRVFQETRFNLMSGVDLARIQHFRAGHYEAMNVLFRVTVPGRRRPGVIPVSGKETDLHRAVLRRDCHYVVMWRFGRYCGCGRGL